MPRVENLGANLEEYGDTTSTHDVCADCYADLMEDPHCYDEELRPYGSGEPMGDGGWGGDVEHPPYEEEECCCAVCGATLTADDDHPPELPAPEMDSPGF